MLPDIWIFFEPQLHGRNSAFQPGLGICKGRRIGGLLEVEKSQNGSGKASKNLMDNRKWFNMLHILGEEGVWEMFELLGWMEAVVQHP